MTWIQVQSLSYFRPVMKPAHNLLIPSSALIAKPQIRCLLLLTADKVEPEQLAQTLDWMILVDSPREFVSVTTALGAAFGGFL
jgi:hypothetical protein